MQDSGPKQRVLTDIEALARGAGFISAVDYVLNIKVRGIKRFRMLSLLCVWFCCSAFLPPLRSQDGMRVL